MMDKLVLRDSTISIMKGIAIIGVVVGHAAVGGIAEFAVNQYHLATFFFVAGMCFKDKYLTDLKTYAWRRFKSLYIPFMQFGLLYLVLHNFFAQIGIEKNPYNATEILHEIRNFTIGLTSEDPLMGAMWFCPALMVVSILSAGVLKVVNKQERTVTLKITILCLVPLLGELLCDLRIKSPRCLWEYMQICGVFYAGYYFSKFKISSVLNGNKRITVALITALMVVVMCIFGQKGNLQPIELEQNFVITTTTIAIISSVCIFCISSLIKDCKTVNKVLSYIGDHSFSIMALHFLAFKSVNEMYILLIAPDAKLSSFPTIETNSAYWISLYILAGVTLPLLLSRMYMYTKRLMFNKI